jgi:hypothetical protein
MRYSNAGEIVVLTVVWAVVLLVLTNVLTAPPGTEEAEVAFSKPQIVMTLRFIGCTNQDSTVIRTLGTLPWLEPARIERDVLPTHSQREATPPGITPAPHSAAAGKPEERTAAACTIRVVAGVKDVAQVEFMQVIGALRSIGIAPAVMMFGGVPSFALQVQMTSNSMGCKPCSQTAIEALEPLPVSAAFYYSTTTNPIEISKHSTFEWVDAKLIDEHKNTLVISVRQNRTARVAQLIRALERTGLIPTSIRVVGVKA